jgi:hypothetical protein
MFVRDSIADRVAELCDALVSEDKPKNTNEAEEVIVSLIQFAACDLARNSQHNASRSIFLAVREVRAAFDFARRVENTE